MLDGSELSSRGVAILGSSGQAIQGRVVILYEGLTSAHIDIQRHTIGSRHSRPPSGEFEFLTIQVIYRALGSDVL